MSLPLNDDAVAPVASSPTPPRQRASLLAWLGCGCCVLLLVVAIVMTAASVMAIAAAKGFAWGVARDAVDVGAYHERAIAILDPQRELPPGYLPVGGIRFPFLLEAAALASGDDSLFLFLDAASFLDPGAGSQPEDWLQPLSFSRAISVDLGQPLGTEAFSIGELSVEQRGYRGEVHFAGRPVMGVLSLLRLSCERDERYRAALWITPDPGGVSGVSRTSEAATAGPREEASGRAIGGTLEGAIEGSAADPKAVADLIGRFRLCPAG